MVDSFVLKVARFSGKDLYENKNSREGQQYEVSAQGTTRPLPTDRAPVTLISNLITCVVTSKKDVRSFSYITGLRGSEIY